MASSLVSYLSLACLFLLFFTTLGKLDYHDIDLTRCLPENICDRVQCYPQGEDCKGEIVKKASICGCCDECVVLLGKDKDCSNIYTPPGGKPLAKCEEGFVCDKSTRTCQEDPNNPVIPICRRVKELRKEVAEEFLDRFSWQKSEDFWQPDCDENTGLFKNKQCKNKKCFCINEKGYRIFGQAEKELSVNMTCACSVAVNQRQTSPTTSLSFLTKPHERCTETGDYEELQCVDEVCYCANTATGKPLGLMVNLDLIEFLPCYKPTTTTVKESYLTRCEKQAIRERRSALEFAQKGITIWGSTDLACDYDGTFGPRQCDKQACHCSNKKGFGMKSYKYDRSGGDETRMTCRCARDEYENEVNLGRYPHWKCDGNGNFEPGQCQAKDCFCVDEDGDTLTTSIKVSQAFASECLTFGKAMDMESMLYAMEILPEHDTHGESFAQRYLRFIATAKVDDQNPTIV